MATGSYDDSLEVARIFLVTNIPPSYGTERGLRNCFRHYCGQEGPQIEYSKLKSPENNTEAALVTIEGLSSDGAHDVLQQKMLLGGRALNVNHVCSEFVTLQYGDVDGHLSQTMQKIVGRLGLQCTIKRKEVSILGPFDLVQQFRMDLKAEIFLNAQCSGYTSVTSGGVTQVPSKKTTLVSFGSSGSKLNEIPSEQQSKSEVAPPFSSEPSPFLKQKTVENDTHILIDNLSPDVLQLLDKIPEGDIPGVQYNPSLGTVTIQGLNKADVEETTAKFEAIYESILAPGPSQFQVDIVQLDNETDINALLSLVNELNHQYVRCTFVHSEDTQMIKILSNSTEQMEQAKKQLLEQLKQPDTITTTPNGPNELTEGGAPAKRSVEEFSTKLKSGHTITIKKGDITKENAAVLVSMINDRFQCVGEMSAAINTASKGNVQQKVHEHARTNPLVNVGDIVVTRGGGALKCKNVYNVVCPDVTDSVRLDDPGGSIRKVVTAVMSEAEQRKARTVVMPSFASAVFGDIELVAKMVSEAIIDHCHQHHATHKQPIVSSITVVVSDESAYSCFVKNLTQGKTRDKSTDAKSSECKAAESDIAGHHTNPPSSTSTNTSYPFVSTTANSARKATENDSNHHTNTPISTQQHPNATTSNNAGEPSTKAEAIANRPTPTPPTATALTSTKPTPTVGAGNTTNPSVSPRLNSKRDHPLYHAPDATKAKLRTKAGSSMIDENCPVCGGPFTTPITSKCEHAFCSQCMDQAAQEVSPICPVCKVAMEGMQSPVCFECRKQVCDAVTTTCCHQIFCRECLTRKLTGSSQCPCCKYSFESVKKAQPLPSAGSMNVTYLPNPLPGYTGCDTIQITYDVPNGIDANGQPYVGANRVAYLPENIEGREILKLLQKAWKDGLIYYISPKSEVVWTDIPHKINTTGGQLNRGYPDPQYFYNVKQSLASKGIVS